MKREGETSAMSMTRSLKPPLTLLAIVLLACLALAAPVQSATINGIADENLGTWSVSNWNAFQATGVKKVRHIVPWDTALPGRAAELQEATVWISAAESKGLEVLISFNYNGCTDNPKSQLDQEGKTCAAIPPTAAEYLDAVAKFREKFPQIKTYTAWNEPNHHHASTYSPGNSANPSSMPHLAAAYWVNLNFVCHLAKYGSNCSVIGGDFLDPNGNGEAFKSYLTTYKATLAESGVSPSTWAIHPYTAAESGNWGLVDSKFMAATESKPVWFTEVGGMICKVGTNGGLTGSDLQGAENFQIQSVKNLLAGIDARPRVQRAYYYSFTGGTSPATCPGPNGYRWDSALFSGDVPRRAHYTAFPGAASPANVFLIFNSGLGVQSHLLNRSTGFTSFLHNLQTVQPVNADSATDWSVEDANGDRVDDLFLVYSNPVSGKVEVHILNGATNYTSYLGNYATVQSTFADNLTDFAVEDANADGKADVFLVFSNPNSGKVEVHILNGATNYTSYLGNYATVQSTFADNLTDFAVEDANADGKADVFLVFSNPNSGKVEVQILNGATNYTSYLGNYATVQSTFADNLTDFAVKDANADGKADVFLVFSNPNSGKVEVHILNGATNYTSYVGNYATVQSTFADNLTEYSVGDANADRKADLFLVYSNPVSGKVEVHILNGATNYTSYLGNYATPQGTWPDEMVEFEAMD
jgi:hypothetical protein